MYESLKSFNYFPTADTRCGNLDQLVVPKREARRLGIEHDDVLLEQPEARLFGTLRQRTIASLDELGRSWQQKLVQRPLMFD